MKKVDRLCWNLVRRVLGCIFAPMRGKPSRQPFFGWLLKQAGLGMGIGTGSEVVDSCEAHGLEFIETMIPLRERTCVFDVGAICGAYIRILLNRLSARPLKIRAFAPSECLYRLL